MNKIDENWDLFEHKTIIRTYLTKLNENWDKKGILTLDKKERKNEWKRGFLLENEVCLLKPCLTKPNLGTKSKAKVIEYTHPCT